VTSVNETRGQAITYNGEYIEALYFSTSNGKTETSATVWGGELPYLRSVESKYDYNSPQYYDVSYMSYPVSLKLLSISKEDLTKIDVIDQSEIDNKQVVLVNLYSYSNACKRMIEYGNTIEVISPDLLRNYIINHAKDIINIYS